MKPKISIIIPIYNVAPFLRKCLDSLLAQTVKDWEAICVDDGSTDGSGDILDCYAAQDGRFRVVHQANAGVSVARQVALELCQGEWVAAVDSDDWLNSDYYDKMLKIAEANPVEMVWSGFTKEFTEEPPMAQPNTAPCGKKVQILSLLDDSLWGGVCLRMIRREFVFRQHLGFSMKHVSVCEDLCFVVAALLAGARVAYVDSVGYHYRMWEGSCLHKGSSPSTYISLMSVADYLVGLSGEPWLKDAVLQWRKSRLKKAYLEAVIPNDVFFAHNGGCKDLWRVNVPVHHKVMYWLAVRGFRTFLMGVVGVIRRSRGFVANIRAGRLGKKGVKELSLRRVA